MDALLLGPFELRRGDTPVVLGDPQQRLTLAVLLSRANRPVSAQRLIDIIWAGQDPPKSNLVPGYVSGLRKAFRESGATRDEIWIDNTPTGYVLRIDPEAIDVVRFERHYDQAAREHDATRRHELLREAVGLWRGQYLEDLDIERVGAVEATSITEKFLDALGDLAEIELLAGNHRWVRDRLRPVLDREPTRQRLAGQLIRALIANGDRVQAMQTYHAVRDALDEYGMETDADLRTLARLAQHVEDYSTLPPAPSAFTGREEELRFITERVRAATDAGRHAVIWISGMPGVGKSSLALAAAHQLSTRFPDGRLLVQLNGFTPNVAPVTSNDALAELLADLGIPPEQIPQALERKHKLYLATLAGSRTMVVLDNAESDEQVRALVPAVPGCLALITSRRVGGVGVTDDVRLDPLPRERAVELFRELVGVDRVGRAAEGVGEVVALCGDLPLSITVVASQLRLHRIWTVEHLAELLREGPDSRFAADSWRAYQVSQDHLSDPQRTLFRLFGHVPGTDLSVLATAALLDRAPRAARALLEELLEVSLLAETTTEHYLMLDPLREFAATVPLDADSSAALDRLLDFYLVTAASAMRLAFPFDRDRQPTIRRTSRVAPEFADAAAARAWLAEERTNLFAAVRFTAGHDRPEHTWQLAVVLWRWHYARGQIREWAETLELARRTIQDDRANRWGLAHVVLRLAGARRQAGEPAQALELAAQALSLWRELGDRQGEAAALCMIALVTLDRGELISAAAHFEAALATFEAIGDQRGQANALDNLGQLNELQGDLELAEARQSKAVRLLRELEHTQGLANALDNLGLTRQRLGRLDEALADHEEARRLAVLVEDRTCEAYALSNIANAHRRAGRPDEALAWHDEARAIADEITNPGLRIQLYLDRADTLLAARDAESARLAYLAALDLATPLGDRGQQANASHGVARALHALDRHDEAVSYWDSAEATLRQLGRPEAPEIHAERTGLRCACRAPAGNAG
jgi:DNA-binding SARP family transcriptional activator/tetratricopeptide (TPR) repeat protein